MEYLEFREVPWSGKTKRIRVMAVLGKNELGKIQYYPGWRSYIFEPSFPTRWSAGCLQKVQDVLNQLNGKKTK